METSDDTLFSKTAPLLAAGCELAYHTVSCSSLNAEELRREGGLQVCNFLHINFIFKLIFYLRLFKFQILLEAYSRCVSVVSLSSKPTDIAVQVCNHISQCYAVAAKFSNCRDVIGEMPTLIVDLCRILQFNVTIFPLF